MKHIKLPLILASLPLFFFLTFFLPGHTLAQESSLNTPNIPRDLSPVIEKNDKILEKARELQQLLEESGESVRESDEFLVKMKDFLLLVVENKLQYLNVLKVRVEKTTVLSAEEKSTVLKLLEGDINFFTEKQKAIPDVESWAKAKKLGDEIRQYSKTIAPRLRGLAGIRSISFAMSLINRARRISDRLEANIEGLLAGDFDGAASATEEEKTEVKEKAEAYQQSLDAIDASLDRADNNVNAAKEVYMDLIQLKEVDKAQEAARLLKETHQALKEARKASLQLTIDIIQQNLNQ